MQSKREEMQKNDKMSTNDKNQVCNIQEVLIRYKNNKKGHANMLKYGVASVDHF